MIVCMGEALIDMIAAPAGAGLEGAETFRPMPGGAPANVAIGCARQGVPSLFMGRISSDTFGGRLLGHLRENGVDTSAVAIDDEAPTTLAFVALDAEGRPDFTFYRDNTADARFAPEDVPLGTVRQCRILHLGTLGMTVESGLTATMLAVKEAAAAGAIISLDPNFRPHLWRGDEARMVAAMDEAAAHADIVKLSDGEYRLLTGSLLIDAATVRRRFPSAAVVLITEGEKGATAVTRDYLLKAEGAGTAAPVDTTGAGDAFDAAFLARLHESGIAKKELAGIKRGTLFDMLTYANATAARATQYYGAVTHWGAS